MKLKLTARQRQQLYEALMSAFPDREALERLASLGLDAQLNLISKGQTYSAVVLSMINHYENTVGQLDKLIEAARMMNPINPEFGTFYEHVWLPTKQQFEKKQDTQPQQIPANDAEEKSESTHRDLFEKAHKEKQTRYSNFMRKKALEFGVDLDASLNQGMVLVCKYILEGISGLLLNDPRLISRQYIDILEEDLREIRNAFESISTQEKRKLLDLKLVKSVPAIMRITEEAYINVCIASKMIDNGSSAYNYEAYFNCLIQCQRAVKLALQYFLV